MEHITQNTKYQRVAVNAYIFNDKGELLLLRSPKQDNYYVAVGGKIEEGETILETLKREVEEETNLDIDHIKFVGVSELKNGIVMLNYSAEAVDGNIKLSEEHDKYDWKKPADWLNKKNIHQDIKNNISCYFLNIEDFEHKYKKALADYQNLLKRTAIEKQEFVKYANEQFLYEILPVYDNLKLAVAHANGNENKTDAVIEGVKYVLGQFKNILENFGVKEIKTVGEKFDHNTMEAIEKKETDDEKKDGMVESEVMSGYVLGERVIRAARVAVYQRITLNI